VNSPTNVSTYHWDLDGKTATTRSTSFDYSTDPLYVPGTSHVVILTMTGPGGTTDKSKVIVAPCP
jgi:hypothetical protein